MTKPILTVGVEATDDSIEQASFDADLSFADYDTVVVDPAVVSALWQGRDKGARAGGGAPAGKVVKLIHRRRIEVADLLGGKGGTLVCLLRPVGPPIRVRRRRSRGSPSMVFHAYSWLPPEAAVSKLVILAATGTQFRAADESHPAWELIQAQGERAAFAAHVANDQLARGWHVVATDTFGHPVAFETSVGEGRLIFVPPIAAADPAERGELIARILGPAAGPSEATPPPHWLSGCLLPEQAGLGARLNFLVAEIARLQAELIDVRGRHAECTDLNVLLYARHCGELCVATATAFRSLGFDVLEVDDQCLEILGPEGDALVVLATAEEAIDSDPYWTLCNRLEGREEPNKGIIVANAYCTQPPAQRGAPFTDLLRRGAHHKELCLLSTVELTAALAEALRRPDDEQLREALRHGILAAVGPCDLAPSFAPGDEPPREHA